MNCFSDELRHLTKIIRRGLFVHATALAHHVVTQRAVGDLCPNIERVTTTRDVVHVLGERFPTTPLNTFVERGARNIFDTFHQFDQRLLAARSNGRKANTTVTHHDCCRTVTGRRVHDFVPTHLAVVVRVHVNPAGRHDGTIGIDGFFGRLGDRATDFNNHPVAHANIALATIGSCAVNNGSTLNDVIKHCNPPVCDLTKGKLAHFEGQN